MSYDQVIYLEKLLVEVRKQSDDELIYALERNLIESGVLNHSDVKNFNS